VELDLLFVELPLVEEPAPVPELWAKATVARHAAPRTERTFWECFMAVQYGLSYADAITPPL
jgi:hypothetical protein